ncbi:MAG: hypothetical protein ACOX52_09935 [Verrucomicrobiota bacterium]
MATSLCRSNFDDFVQEEHIAHMIELGVHYLWYYIYRPAGPRPTPELALSKDQIQYLRSFLVQQRPKHPILIIDAYWDQDGNALCPAASGISYHINPFGDIEPCPPIQMSDDHVADGREVIAKIRDSNFLRDFRSMASRRTRGCIIMEDPALLRAFAADHNAHDSSGRGTYFGELESLRPCPGASPARRGHSRDPLALSNRKKELVLRFRTHTDDPVPNPPPPHKRRSRP